MRESGASEAAWVTEFFERLAARDRERSAAAVEQAEALELEYRGLLERRTQLAESALRVHKHRENLLTQEIELLRASLEGARARISDQSEVQNKIQEERSELRRRLAVLERELAAQRLRQSAMEDGDTRQRPLSLPPLPISVASSRPRTPNDDTSVASPALHAVVGIDNEQLSFEVSALRGERDLLKRELRTMEEILEGAGSLPQGFGLRSRDEWILRAAAAESTNRALGFLLRKQLARSGPAQEVGFFARLAEALQGRSKDILEVFEREQQRWSEREQAASSRADELERRCRELRDEVEEACSQAEQQRLKAREEAAARVESEQRVREVTEELRTREAELSGLRGKQGDVRDELSELREAQRQVHEQLVEALRARDRALELALETSEGMTLTDLNGHDDFRAAADIALQAAQLGLAASQAARLDWEDHQRPAPEGHLSALESWAASLEERRLVCQSEQQSLELKASSTERLAGARAEAAISAEQALVDAELARRTCAETLQSVVASVTDSEHKLEAQRAELARVRARLDLRRAEQEQRAEALEAESASMRGLSERLEEQLLELGRLGEELVTARAHRPGEDEAEAHETRLAELETEHHSVAMLIDQLRNAHDEAEQRKQAMQKAFAEAEAAVDAAHATLESELAQQREFEDSLIRSRELERSAQQALDGAASDRRRLEETLEAARREAARAAREAFLVRLAPRQRRREGAWIQFLLGEIGAEAKAWAEVLDGKDDAAAERARTLTAQLPNRQSLDSVESALRKEARRVAQVLVEQRVAVERSLDSEQEELRRRAVRLRSGKNAGPEAAEELASNRAARAEIERRRLQARGERESLASSDEVPTDAIVEALRDRRAALALVLDEGQQNRLEGLLGELDKKLASAEIAAARTCTAELRQILSECEARRAGLRAELARSRSEARRVSTMHNLLSDPEGERRSLLDGAQSLVVALTEANARETEARRRWDQLERESQSLQSQLSDYESESGRLTADRDSLAERLRLKESELKSLEEKSKARERSDLVELEQKLEESERARQALTTRLTRVQAEASIKLKEVEAERERSERARKDAENFVERHEKQLAEIRGAQSEDGEGAEGISPEAQKLLKAKERQIRKLKAFLDSERKRIEQLTEERQRLKDHISRTRGRATAVLPAKPGGPTTSRVPAPRPQASPSNAPPPQRTAPAPQAGAGVPPPPKGRTGRVDLATLRLGAAAAPPEASAMSRDPRAVIRELQANLKRAESRAEDMAKVVRLERARRSESLNRSDGPAAPAPPLNTDGRVAELQLQVQRMKTRLDRESNARAAAERSSQTKLEELARKLKDAERELEDRTSRVARLEAEVAARERRALTADAKALRLSRELEEARAAMLSQERKLKHALQELSEREDRVGQLERHLDDARKASEMSESESSAVAELELAVEEARREASKAREELERSEERLNDQQAQRDVLEQSVREAEDKVAELSQRLQESGVLNLNHVREHKRLTEELERARLALEEREGALGSAMSTLEQRSRAVAQLEEKLAYARSEQSTDRERAQRTVAEIEAQLQAARAEVQERSETIQALTEKVQSDQKIRDDLEKTAEFAQELVSRVSDLQLRLRSSKERVEHQTREIQSFVSDVQEQERLEAMLQAQVDDARRVLTKIDSEGKNDEATKLRRMEQQELLEDLQSRLEQAQHEIHETRVDLEVAVGQLQSVESDAQDLSTELEQTQTRLDQVAAHQEDLTADLLGEPENDPETAALSSEQLSERLEEERRLREHAEAMTHELAGEYQREMESLRLDLAASQDELRKREAELSATRQRLHESEDSAQTLRAEAQALRESIRVAEAEELASATGRRGRSTERLEELRAELVSKDEALQNSLLEARRHREQAAELEARLEASRVQQADNEERAQREQEASRAWLAELNEVVGSTQARLGETERELELKKTELERLRRERDSLQSRLNEEQNHRRQLDSELRANQKRLEKVEALRGAELWGELGAPVHPQPSAEADSESQELLHWIVAEGVTESERHPAALAELITKLQRRRQGIYNEAREREGLDDDTRALWRAMCAQAEIDECDDVMGWLKAGLRSQMVAADADSDYERLTRRFKKLEKAIDWSAPGDGHSGRLREEMSRTRSALEELGGVPKNEGVSVEDEADTLVLAAYDERIQELMRELDELREQKRGVEREALHTLEVIDAEKIALEAEIGQLRSTLSDLDQVVVSMHTSAPEQRMDALVRELSALRGDLRNRQQDVFRLEMLLGQDGNESLQQLREAWTTIDRLQGMLEDLQEENERLQSQKEE